MLIYSKDQSEHNERLEAVLKCIEAPGVKIITQVFEVIVEEIGVQADPAKTKVINANTTECKSSTCDNLLVWSIS